MSLSINNILGDIVTAQSSLSPLRNYFNDESLYNIAAYHAEQATEKCLKIILSNYYGIDESLRRYRTHNIPDLLAFLEEQASENERPIPIEIPNIIYELSNEIMEWEATTRYNDNMVILRRSIKEVLKADIKMYRQIKKLLYY